VNSFQTRGRAAQSPAVQQLVTRGLPYLQEHLTLARQGASQVGADVSGGVATGVDTTSAIPGAPPRTDTTTVVGRYPQPNQPGENRRNDTDRQTTGRQTEEERARQGNVNADAQFIRDVDASHFLQVRLGRLAKDKARNSEVKRFGEQMEKGHADFQKQWSKMASSNGMKHKSGMGPDHRANLERLEKLSGNAFDQAYMTFMIQSHNGYLNYWRREGRAARSAPVRQVVNRGLPTMQEHMDMAKRIGGRVGVDAKTALAGRRVAGERSDPGTVIE
ncbi:MAG: DUF4142 domain-containing protein, partial [Gemmatimonadota bacterium]|nr:DUF4142 domain-containing protein [Gemmatimonadota bacterium]